MLQGNKKLLPHKMSVVTFPLLAEFGLHKILHSSTQFSILCIVYHLSNVLPKRAFVQILNFQIQFSKFLQNLSYLFMKISHHFGPICCCIWMSKVRPNS